MKKISLIILCMSIMLVIAGCGNKCNHSWSEWERVKDPTCEATGLEERICSLCNEKDTKSINKLEHFFGTRYGKDENSHFKMCNICGTKEEIEEHISNVDRYENVYCSVCNYLLEENTNDSYNSMFKLPDAYIAIVNNRITSENYDHHWDENHQLIKELLSLGEWDITGELIVVEDSGKYSLVFTGQYEYVYEDYINEEYNETTQYQVKAVLQDDVLYGVYESAENGNIDTGCYEMTISEALAMFGVQLESMEKIENVTKDILKFYGYAENEIFDDMFDMFFTVDSLEGNQLELKLILDIFINKLSFIERKSFEDFIEYLFNDEFENVKDNLYRLLDVKLSILIDLLKAKYGIDLEKYLLELADVLGLSKPNIMQFFKDEELLNKSLKELLSEETLEKVEVIEIFEDFLSFVKECYEQILYIYRDLIYLLEENMPGIELIIYTDEDFRIQSIDLTLEEVVFGANTIEAKLILNKFSDMDKFEKIKQEILESYNEVLKD